MAATIHMPQWGMTMTEGTIVKWLKKEGDLIEKGDLLFEVETEKIVNQVEAMQSGVLFQIVVPEGAAAPVGAVVGLLANEGESPARIDCIAAGEGPAVQAASDQSPGTEDSTGTAEKPFVKATPAARRLARELSIDLTCVGGTGTGGRVIEKDVARHSEDSCESRRITPLARKIGEKAGVDFSAIEGTGTAGKITRADVEQAMRSAVESAPESGTATTSIPYRGMRKSIGDNMMASLQNSAQLTAFAEVDVTEMVRFRDMMREAYKQDETVRISFNDIVILAVSRALKHHPIMNSTRVGDEILLHDSVNMGIAVALPDGLIVPVLKDAHRKGLLEIACESRDLAGRARQGGLGPDDFAGGTFTISNTSMLEVDGFTPILRPPESAILGIGRAKRKPAEYQGEIVLRWLMWLALTYDHCVVDGYPAHQFLTTLGRYLQNPYLIMS